MSAASWHASPERLALPTTDRVTGEVRIPISLFSVDRLQARIPLVLSRREDERLLGQLTELLGSMARLTGVRP